MAELTTAPARAPKPVARTLGTVPVLLAFGLLLAAVLTTQETYEQLQDGHGVAAFDEPVHRWFYEHRVPSLNGPVTLFTDLGGKIGMPIIALLGVLALARIWRTRTPIIVMLVATTGSIALTVMGKELTARARPPASEAVPPLETSPSFPSGHSLNATVVAVILGYLVLLYVVSLRARLLALVGLAAFAVLIGISRVYLGHHWLTDVIAGWAVGAAWAMAVVLGHWLYVRLRTRERADSVREIAQAHRAATSA